MTGQKRKLIFLFTSRISQQLNISTIQSRMMTIQEIKTIQISDFLANKGYEPVSKKGSKWWYLSPLHSERTASFKVDQTKNLWYDFGLGKGGNILDLAMELYHTESISEVLHLMSQTAIIPIQQRTAIKPEEKSSFEIQTRQFLYVSWSLLSSRAKYRFIKKSSSES